MDTPSRSKSVSVSSVRTSTSMSFSAKRCEYTDKPTRPDILVACILLLARRSRRDVGLIVTGKDAFPCSPYGISRHKLKHLDADLGHTTIRNPQAARGTERQVEDAAANPWSAVGDHNYYRSVGRKISNANSRAERQAAVRCSWQIPIER